ncbi:MAG: glycosyltransferase family 2 protein [Alicyclobacillus sp.]|nr:glycosyltransferase family 2 protein [Alicyclobacillus sp.]
MKSTLVILVNYNGSTIIGKALQSLRQQTVKDFDVLVVDNNSCDDSVSFIRREYPEVKIFEAGHNYGFAKGNNIGLRQAMEGGYRYAALLNTDAAASSNWLADLMSVMETDSNVAVASSKLLFWTDFLPLTFEVDTHSPSCISGSPDTRQLGILIGEGPHVSTADYDKVFYGVGWWPPEGSLRWTTEHATCYVALPEKIHEGPVYVVVRCRGIKRGQMVKVKVGETEVGSFTPNDQYFASYVVAVPFSLVQRSKLSIINNYGSYVDVMGYGHDVGFGTPDVFPLSPYYADAFCGANALIRISALSNTGLFDESYFMYYEDTELSLRLREMGYTIYISPNSYVRHLHSASSQYNPKMYYYIERNRRTTLARYGTTRQFLWIHRNTLYFCVRKTSEMMFRILMFRPGIRHTIREATLAFRLALTLLMTLGSNLIFRRKRRNVIPI